MRRCTTSVRYADTPFRKYPSLKPRFFDYLAVRAAVLLGSQQIFPTIGESAPKIPVTFIVRPRG
jgi:hypothetical protein